MLFTQNEEERTKPPKTTMKRSRHTVTLEDARGAGHAQLVSAGWSACMCPVAVSKTLTMLAAGTSSAVAGCCVLLVHCWPPT